MFCTSCGTRLSPNAKFCTACGTPLSAPPAQAPAQPAAQPVPVQDAPKPPVAAVPTPVPASVPTPAAPTPPPPAAPVVNSSAPAAPIAEAPRPRASKSLPDDLMAAIRAQLKAQGQLSPKQVSLIVQKAISLGLTAEETTDILEQETALAQKNGAPAPSPAPAAPPKPTAETVNPAPVADTSGSKPRKKASFGWVLWLLLAVLLLSPVAVFFIMPAQSLQWMESHGMHTDGLRHLTGHRKSDAQVLGEWAAAKVAEAQAKGNRVVADVTYAYRGKDGGSYFTHRFSAEAGHNYTYYIHAPAEAGALDFEMAGPPRLKFSPKKSTSSLFTGILPCTVSGSYDLKFRYANNASPFPVRVLIVTDGR